MASGRRSAGVLLWRRTGQPSAREPGGAEVSAGLEVLVGHMGGPFWSRKDAGAWSLPKGELEPEEEPLEAARRELVEELGLPAPKGVYAPLGEVRQSGGKVVMVWAVEADLDPAEVVPGTFTMEWPPRSGRQQEFPELDRVAWLTPDRARELLVPAQAVFIDRLERLTSASRDDGIDW